MSNFWDNIKDDDNKDEPTAIPADEAVPEHLRPPAAEPTAAPSPWDSIEDTEDAIFEEIAPQAPASTVIQTEVKDNRRRNLTVFAIGILLLFVMVLALTPSSKTPQSPVVATTPEDDVAANPVKEKTVEEIEKEADEKAAEVVKEDQPATTKDGPAQVIQDRTGKLDPEKIKQARAAVIDFKNSGELPTAQESEAAQTLLSQTIIALRWLDSNKQIYDSSEGIAKRLERRTGIPTTAGTSKKAGQISVTYIPPSNTVLVISPAGKAGFPNISKFGFKNKPTLSLSTDK